MIRIVCPHCHTPLSLADLEAVEVNGVESLLCPECTLLLLSESLDVPTLPTPSHERLRIAETRAGWKT